MRKPAVLLSIVLIAVCLASCATGPVKNTSGQFPLTQTQKSQSTAGLLRGTVNFGAGYFFPTSNDIIDISLLKTDGTTGLITEISHSRIRRPPNFPIQFSMSYDTADIAEGDTCTLIVTLLVGDEITRQGMTLLTRTEVGFADASLTLLSI
ncbi:MAG: hypothetical protein IKT95_00680 [Spirochaetales bacterium]|nr:hypothetical protein [Spirochaetales bacterium]